MLALTSPKNESRRSARRTLVEAQSFRKLGQMGVEAGLTLPAVSNLHEAARLAVTAIATLNGRRFTNSAGAHEAVVDYALAVGMVNRGDYARLDELRQLRHAVNYPADLISPSPAELNAVVVLVDKVLDAAAKLLPPPRIPPPPGHHG